MDIINKLSPLFERYITLERVHPSRTYDYKARQMYGLPVFECTMHRPKCAPGTWTYIAVRSGSNAAVLSSEDRLYVGSQTADRMFRGDRMGGENFHHAQMRAGNGTDTPEAYLRAGNRIDILRLDASQLRSFVGTGSDLKLLQRLVSHPPKHAGYWLEQLVLHLEPGGWRWNTSGATREVSRLVREAQF